MRSRVFIQRNLTLRLLAVAAFVFALAAAALHAQPIERPAGTVANPAGPRDERQERRNTALDADTTRFFMHPFATRAKLYKQTYSHTEMNTTPSSARPKKPLYVKEDPASTYCANRSLRNAMVYARLMMGPIDYEFDTVDFDVTATFKVAAYKTGAVTSFADSVITLNISSVSNVVKPEQWNKFAFTSYHDSVDSFRINIQTYTFNSSTSSPILDSLKANVRLEVWYTEDFATEAVVNGSPTTPPLTVCWLPTADSVVTANPVAFKWARTTECKFDSFPDYQFQLLRLFNRSADSFYVADEQHVVDTLDWSRALTIETGNSDTTLTLTVAEGTGYYVWRVRPIGDEYPGGIANDRNWGPWTVAAPNGPITINGRDEASVDSAYRPALFFYASGSRERNWIYGRTFTEGAEGTRISENMTYATELLQPRQVQAHMQSNDSMVLHQTVYDFAGRAALSSMAAPRAWSGFAFRTDFMYANSSSGTPPYTAEQFDADANYRNPGIVGASATVAQYYSDQTPSADARIPSAGGYPFQRTLFYPDATGRTSEQGGAGRVFRIGGGADTTSLGDTIPRTVRMLYGKAGEDELIALFGDEAPDDGTVQKVVSIDPNKIASVTFISKEGQTLATCLVKPASSADLHLTELGNETAAINRTVTQHLGTNRPSGEFGAEASTTITLMEKGPLNLHYTLLPKNFHTSCENICSFCDYHVDILIVPADDPSTAVFTKSYTIPAAACSADTVAVDTALATGDLEPGSYTVIRRIRSGGTSAEGGLLRDSIARAEQSAVRALFDARLSRTRTFLEAADLGGLYTYLDSLNPFDSALGYDSASATYTMASGCYALTIPKRVCDPDNPCGSAEPNFEAYLYKKWGPGNYAYGGDTAANFGAVLDKYFYYPNPWDPIYAPGDTGRFNTLVHNMLADTLYNDSLYTCSRLWAIWRDLVDGFGYAATDHHLGNPADRTPGYNLLEEFLRRAGTHYIGVSTCKYGDCAGQFVDDGIHGTYAGFGMGYLDWSYKFFRYTIDYPGNEDCRKQIGLRTYSGIALPIVIYPTSGPLIARVTDLIDTLDYDKLHDCLNSRPSEAAQTEGKRALPNDCADPTGRACTEALRDAMQDTCRSGCERKRMGFRKSVVDAWHEAGETIEGEHVTPAGEPVDDTGHILDSTGTPTGTVITFVPLERIDCQASQLVEHCAGGCTLDLVQSGDSIIGVGTATQLARFARSTGFGWTVAVPSGGGACGGGFDTVGTALSPHAYAAFVVRAMNDTLRAVRAAWGDTAAPLTVSARLRSAFASLTGDSTCRWDTVNTSHNADSGCCPPLGLPKLFTFSPTIISAHFELDGCGLLYSRTCIAEGRAVVQRAVLCDSICFASCSEPICFRWDSLVAPVATGKVEPLTCERLIAADIMRSLGAQVNGALAAHQAATAAAYNTNCGSPENINDDLEIAYPVSLYHFTLYYYDRAGRLVRTVPPAGVVPLGPGSTRATHPSHTLATSYEYNSLGQLTRKRTPDAGLSRVFYDSKGRARFTQSAEQIVRDAFTYTKFDELGRAVETGETSTTAVSDLKTKADSTAWPSSAGATDVYLTTYTTTSGKYYLNDSLRPQRYLRNRASSSEALDGSQATYYSYDPHGNVEWIVQYIRGLGDNYIRYEYDLISGNMLALYYNEGLGDQLTQRWRYDEDNRITRVESSRDGVIWDRDAQYHYFLHGPLRRAEYGEDSLQGADYTYTLQGWTKALNHPTLSTSLDPGRDGDATAAIHARYAPDAYAMALTYFEGDFLRKQGSTQSPFNSVTTTVAGVSYTKGSGMLSPALETSGAPKNLYNGNIAAWTNNTQAAGAGAKYEQLTGEQYTYDRLNRLLGSAFNTWASSAWSSTADYGTSYTYDPNGNILTLVRAGAASNGRSTLDNLSYTYVPGGNRLSHVDDAVTSTVSSSDLDDETALNYTYDASGRLVGDRIEGIGRIAWSPYTKVRAVTKTAGGFLRFGYDAAGNRVKKVAFAGEAGTTYYVREAGGRVIAIYTRPCIDPQDMLTGPGSCGDGSQTDTDHDGVPDLRDNAPSIFNPDQHDTDGDGAGDVDDADIDGDGTNNGSDPCPYDPLNSCTGDMDSDGIPDAIDPCSASPGNGGGDQDGDGTPDDCDLDIDGDGVTNDHDNCPWTPNGDQADADQNGVGDACDCNTMEGASCGIVLAEQFVYGSEPDGRVVTIKPDRARDMASTATIRTFTRVMREREYELNDHLGNVRYRFSDLKRTTGGAGHAPFKADMLGYDNYYPFGMMPEDRRATALTGGIGRYGYNGKEMDNEFNDRNGAGDGTANSYDYGFRMYEPRLGKFLSEDPLTADYPWYTPYQYAGNMPIWAVDLDGLEPIAPTAAGGEIYRSPDMNDADNARLILKEKARHSRTAKEQEARPGYMFYRPTVPVETPTVPVETPVYNPSPQLPPLPAAPSWAGPVIAIIAFFTPTTLHAPEMPPVGSPAPEPYREPSDRPLPPGEGVRRRETVDLWRAPRNVGRFYEELGYGYRSSPFYERGNQSAYFAVQRSIAVEYEWHYQSGIIHIILDKQLYEQTLKKPFESDYPDYPKHVPPRRELIVPVSAFDLFNAATIVRIPDVLPQNAR